MTKYETRESVLAAVYAILSEEFFNSCHDPLNEETRIIADLNADSLDLGSIAMEIEEEFDVPDLIPDEKTDRDHTVGEIVDRLCARLGIVSEPPPL